MFQRTRILMTEADAGNGNGAVASQSSAEPAAVPQAQGDAVTLSKSELDALIASATEKAVASAKDSIFAEARRTFAGSKKSEKPKEAEPAPSASPTIDATKLRSLDRALAKHGWADRLNESQYKRVERAFAEDSPEDATSWVKDYFDGLGVAQPATTAQAAPAAVKPVSEHPVSNRGAPPPAQVPIEEIDLFAASDSDRAAFIKAKGPKAYVAQLQKQAKGRPVRLG